MDFRSDNVAGVAPEIMAALAKANEGTSASYGADDITARVERRLTEIFEHPLRAFPVVTGTSANSLALAVMTPPFGAIYCHEAAHIMVDECGAPEMYTGGAKLVPMAGKGAKITAADLDRALADAGIGEVHHVQPAAISLTQATELGTCYRAAEIEAIGEIAARYRLGLHMDGARFANALVHLGAKPKDITWKAGVRALSLGATKNGALAAEIVILFDPVLAETFAYRRKRAGHLISKMRFVSAQLDAYFIDDLWLRLARHANAMAKDLAAGLLSVPGMHLLHAVEANEIFAKLPAGILGGLRRAGFSFYDWPGAEPGTIRLVTSFATDPRHVAAFISTAKNLASAAA
jgi:threonine aldolase